MRTREYPDYTYWRSLKADDAPYPKRYWQVIAGNPSCPREVYAELSDRPEMLAFVVENPNPLLITHNLLKRALGSANWQARHAAAENPCLTPELIEAFFPTSTWGMRLAFANHGNTPLSVLKALASLPKDPRPHWKEDGSADANQEIREIARARLGPLFEEPAPTLGK